MAYLVFGGAGFIGINFVDELIKNNQEVIVFDKLTQISNKKIIRELKNKKKIEFLKFDICNSTQVLDTLVKYKPKYVINFAAESHVDKSIKNPNKFIKTNIFGTYSILEALKNYLSSTSAKGVELKFLNVSTDEVFGSLDLNAKAFTEKSKYLPNSPYSASKGSADQLVRAYFKTYDIPTITTNCSNNYGPFQNKEKLIPLVISKCLKRENIPIYGDGMNIRDWIYVKDHCNALYKLLKDGKIGSTYNIGGNFEIENINLVKLICKKLDKKHPIQGFKYTRLISFVKDRLGHDKRYAVNSNKIFKEIKWKPEVSFNEGINQTLDWYLKNLD